MLFVGAVTSNSHFPKLLLLDEPTVGMDPELRQRVWQFLREISTKFDVSTIITTHYIEEAEQADSIGFMRQALSAQSAILFLWYKEGIAGIFLVQCGTYFGGDLMKPKKSFYISPRCLFTSNALITQAFF